MYLSPDGKVLSSIANRAALSALLIGLAMFAGCGVASPIENISDIDISENQASDSSSEKVVEAVVDIIRGAVSVRVANDEAWQKIEEKTAIAANTIVKTGESSIAEITFPDGSVARLAPETILKVEKFPKSIDQSRTDLRLYGGEVWNTVLKVKGRNADYRVQTDNALALVRGTSFDVAYAKGKSRILVNESNVEAITNDDEHILLDRKGGGLLVGEKIEKFKPDQFWNKNWFQDNVKSDVKHFTDLREGDYLYDFYDVEEGDEYDAYLEDYFHYYLDETDLDEYSDSENIDDFFSSYQHEDETYFDDWSEEDYYDDWWGEYEDDYYSEDWWYEDYDDSFAEYDQDWWDWEDDYYSEDDIIYDWTEEDMYDWGLDSGYIDDWDGETIDDWSEWEEWDGYYDEYYEDGYLDDYYGDPYLDEYVDDVYFDPANEDEFIDDIYYDPSLDDGYVEDDYYEPTTDDFYY